MTHYHEQSPLTHGVAALASYHVKALLSGLSFAMLARIRVRCIHIQSVTRSIVNQLINSASGALMTARDTATPHETHLSTLFIIRAT
jgi:hypothetical protein